MKGNQQQQQQKKKEKEKKRKGEVEGGSQDGGSSIISFEGVETVVSVNTVVNTANRGRNKNPRKVGGVCIYILSTVSGQARVEKGQKKKKKKKKKSQVNKRGGI